jgi:hypothetical protein
MHKRPDTTDLNIRPSIAPAAPASVSLRMPIPPVIARTEAAHSDPSFHCGGNVT